MMTRKALLGLLLFGVSIFTMASVSAYIVDGPPIYEESIVGFGLPGSASQNTVAKSSNGTLYVLAADVSNDHARLYKSINGYNWTQIHTFSGDVYDACMAINSTGILHILISETSNYLSYIAFDPTVLVNITYWQNCICPVGMYACRMEINSSDGIRAMYINGSHYGIYFFNGSDFTYMDIPGSSNMGRSAITIAENDTIYMVGGSATGSVTFSCWDEGNSTLVDLGTVNVGGSTTKCGDIFVNNTTIAALAVRIAATTKLIYSSLPGISWITEDRDSGLRFFHMNGSRLELTGPSESTSKIWNTSYYNGSSWTEIRNIRLVDSSEEDYSIWYYPSFRRNRFHEADFWSGKFDMKWYCKNSSESTGFEVWAQIYPDVAPLFSDLVVDTTYNESYLVDINPRDLNPQDIIVSVLQDTNAEDDWLEYSGGVLSGIVGETAYNNTTVWIEISIDDGITNFTHNFTFISERQQLLYTTSLPQGYLNVHYRGGLSIMNNTTWYVVTNANWADVDNTTDEITGYPPIRGSFWFHIYVNDVNSNNMDDRNITVVVGIHPTDMPSKITYLVTSVVMVVVGVVVVITILYSILGSMGSTINRFGKS